MKIIGIPWDHMWFHISEQVKAIRQKKLSLVETISVMKRNGAVVNGN